MGSDRGAGIDVSREDADKVADWLRSNEEQIARRMRGGWRDSHIVKHEQFDVLVMAVVVEVAAQIREQARG